MKGLDWRRWRKLPELLAHRLEAIHPELGKQALNYASRATDLTLLASNFRLLEWTDERVGLRLEPAGLGPLVTASEFMIRNLIGRHVPSAQEALSFKMARVEVLTGLNRHLYLRMELSATDREAWLREAQIKGTAPREFSIPIWSDQDRRLGEVTIEAALRHQALLPGQT